MTLALLASSFPVCASAQEQTGEAPSRAFPDAPDGSDGAEPDSASKGQNEPSTPNSQPEPANTALPRPMSPPVTPVANPYENPLPTGAETLPYEEGKPIPAGYRLEQSRNRGLIIAGSIVLPVSYAYGLFLGFARAFSGSSSGAEILVPVAGPWIFLAKYQRWCGGPDYAGSAIGEACEDRRRDENREMIIDGLLQASGATLIIWGIVSRRTRLVRADVARITIVPTPVPGGYGAIAVGHF